MCKFLEKDITKYEVLWEKGKKAMESELWDGEYFIQQIKWTGLNAADPVEVSKKSFNSDYSPEALAILQKEGPKYQYGNGCLSDGVLGSWLGEVSV
jgi:hypothetical protein